MPKGTTGLYPTDRQWELADKGQPHPGVLIGGPAARSKQLEYSILAILQVGGALAAVWWLFTNPSGWVEWSAFISGYLIINYGLSCGFHRYFTHRSFETSLWMRYLIGICGQMACQGSVKKWAADHRRHHAFSDEVGDLHSPHVDGHGRRMGPFKGLLISHLGWLWDNAHTDMRLYGKGLVGDPVVEFCHRTRWFWVAFSLVLLPAAWALAFGGPEHVVGTVLVGGFLRTFIFLNGVMGTNSLAHYFGYRRYHDVGKATNNWFITILTLGDGWHNNHHAQPRAASNRVGWWELDFNGWTIETLGKMGLVWNVQKRDKNRPAGYPEPHEMVGKPVMAFAEPAKAHSKADELVA